MDNTKDAENVLFRWTRNLPLNLRLSQKQTTNDVYDLRTHDFRARQLHVPYFICLAILARSTVPRGKVSAAALLSASFVAGIYEDFLARDQIKFLPPIFTSFCLVSGIILLSARPYPNLWEAAQPDLRVIKNGLKELSKRWRSATGASKALVDAIDSPSCDTSDASMQPPLRFLNEEQTPLFEGFSLELCRMWPAYKRQTILQETDEIGSSNVELQGNGNGNGVFSASLHQVPVPVAPFGFTPGGEQYFMSPQYDGIQNWFMSDWGMGGTS
jgi:hypothetical protein